MSPDVMQLEEQRTINLNQILRGLKKLPVYTGGGGTC